MPKIKTKNEFIIHIQDFIDYCKLKNLSIKTIKSYYQTLALFDKYLMEEMNIASLKDLYKLKNTPLRLAFYKKLNSKFR